MSKPEPMARSVAADIIGVRGRSISVSRWAAPILGLVAAVLAWLRLAPVVRNTLYAEDGVLFLHDAAVRGTVSLIFEPYAGYQHFIPRITAWLVTSLLPVAWWGAAVVALSCIFVGIIAALVFHYSGDVISYLPSRIMAGLIVVLLPLAGIEPLGNLANLHWFLLYLTPWVLIASPRSQTGLWFAVLAMLLATLTEPQCLVFAPLVIWRFVFHPRTRVVMIAWAIGIAVQGLTFLTAPRARVEGRPPLLSIAQGYVVEAGMSIGTSRASWLGWVLNRWGWWVGFGWVLAILLLAGVGVLLGRMTAKALLISLVLASVTAWALAFVVNNIPTFYFSQMTPDQLANPPLVRWGTAASMMLAATIPVAISVLVERFPRWWPAGLVTLSVILLAMAINLSDRPGAVGRTWSEQVVAGTGSCAANQADTFEVLTQPTGWGLRLPCSVLDE